MKADKHETELLNRALSEWAGDGLLTSEQADILRRSITPRQTSRQQIAQYFFFIALFCTLMAFGAIFINEKLLEKIKAYFSLTDLTIAIITAGLGALWFWYVGKKIKHISATPYEIYMVLGGLAILTSLIYLCKYFHIDGTYTAFLSMALPVLMVLSISFRSKALWIGSVIASVAWFYSFSRWLGHDHRFLGMNYPVRFTAFGMAIIGVSYIQQFFAPAQFARRITYVSGMMLFFTALWQVSVFGNYNSLADWQQVRQVHVLAYSLVFGLAAAGSFYLGIRFKDDIARDFGVLFLLINLYTRYFEYFWDAMNKGIFFLILAITFGLLGWLLERRRKPAAAKQ